MTGGSRTEGVRLSISPVDLDQTLGCGQTFRWRRLGPGRWQGPLGDCLATLTAHRRALVAESVPHRGDLGLRVATYLRADDDIGRIHSILSEDEVLAGGLPRMRGLRLVKMDEWECLVSYVLATYANIPRITGMIESLAARYGEDIGGGVRAFPALERLKRASAAELRACGLGYRAEHVRKLCAQLGRDDLESMKLMRYGELRCELKALPGVGDKVADCVALFGFGRLESFPIDVWVERALERLYGVEGPYSRLRRFATDRFGACAGYAQEYLYFNERALARRGACAFTRPGGSSDRTP